MIYDENAPIPFEGSVEGEPETSWEKGLLFAGGMIGPMGYMNGLAYPFFDPPLVDGEEEEVDPNP